MKKIFNRLMATALASSCMFSAVAMSGNAIYSLNDINSPDLDFLDNGEYGKCILIDKKYNDYFVDDYIYSDEQIRNTSIYCRPDGMECFGLIPVNEKFGEGAFFNLADGTTEEEFETFFYEKIASNYNVVKFWPKYDYKISASLKECREVCNLLKEENLIDSFVIIDNVVQLVKYSFAVGDILGYDCSEEQLELMENYVKETDIADIQVVKTDNRPNVGIYTEIILKPKTETTVEERLDMALQIKEDTGISSYFITPESNTTTGTSCIDVFNAVDGDANVDGDMNMADVATVVQMIGNPDEYTVTSQGEFNADLDGNGLTAADAFEIQKKIAEKGLPQ